VDLFAVDVGQMEPVPHSPTSTVTVTLQARISNIGNVAITQPVSIRFLDGDGYQIGSEQVISETVAGCAGVKEITVTWSNVPSGAHVVRVIVDPGDEISEGNEDNNEAYGVVLVAQEQFFLPLVARRR
jgi:subtilase family serine protease